MNASLMKWLALSMVGMVMSSAVVLASSVQDQARPETRRMAQPGASADVVVAAVAAPAASSARAE
ncbi:hypothetical protein [Paucibacter sp. DJ2R-2]|uniref:hypothetical protein n=1 Tax=Paucibacter sp. DJ2R-2 TaxID=2893558 RepID=UPI0021E3F176|nr:hypothetical protein [Paucibacter sp. DJ2R-2]MCV2421306.1 hypothetical protein [Paucibacter sp. DJ4R-1]MCV2441239.1 hypothetical protein [Paucibacter sp. DJ2R-2]